MSRQNEPPTLIELTPEFHSQLAAVSAERASQGTDADTSTAAAAIARQILDLGGVTPVVVIELRAGTITDVRVHPTETVVVTFDWDELATTTPLEAQQNLQALAEVADQLPPAVRPLLAETLIEAKALVADRHHGATR